MIRGRRVVRKLFRYGGVVIWVGLRWGCWGVGGDWIYVRERINSRKSECLLVFFYGLGGVFSF